MIGRAIYWQNCLSDDGCANDFTELLLFIYLSVSLERATLLVGVNEVTHDDDDVLTTYARTDTNSVAIYLHHPLPTSLFSLRAHNNIHTPFLRLLHLNGNKRKFKFFEFFPNPIVLIPTYVTHFEKGMRGINKGRRMVGIGISIFEKKKRYLVLDSSTPNIGISTIMGVTTTLLQGGIIDNT